MSKETNLIFTTGFKCPVCGEIHHEYKQAKECCDPTIIKEVNCFKCPVCDNISEDPNYIAGCCDD